jgi:Integrase core domain
MPSSRPHSTGPRIRSAWAILTPPPRSPKANAFCERLIGTLRRECLDWIIPLSEWHLRALVRASATHYNRARPHTALRSVQERLREHPRSCKLTVTGCQQAKLDSDREANPRLSASRVLVCPRGVAISRCRVARPASNDTRVTLLCAARLTCRVSHIILCSERSMTPSSHDR